VGHFALSLYSDPSGLDDPMSSYAASICKNIWWSFIFWLWFVEVTTSSTFLLSCCVSVPSF